jgi:hypothetical protein
LPTSGIGVLRGDPTGDGERLGDPTEPEIVAEHRGEGVDVAAIVVEQRQ